MEERIDLTYVTERIISIFCPGTGPEETHLPNLRDLLLMLRSKHGHNCMLVNLSQHNDAIAQTNHKVLDTGWVESLAPRLDQILSVCRAMEDWLQTDPQHVLAIHCRGGMGALGLLLASYIHVSDTSASADLSLDRFAMSRFYDDKLSTLMTPSQKRYVRMMGSVLAGGRRLRPSPSFLLCIVLRGLPEVGAGRGCRLFLRVYQSLRAVYTSAVYHVAAGHTDRVYFPLCPAQLLRGDVMVVCYDTSPPSRRVVFRLQFHTGLLQEDVLTFQKPDLDCASEDPQFPEDGKVELLLSDSLENITGRELWVNAECVTVDYNNLDPLVRRDSYLHTAPPQNLDPGNSCLYAGAREKVGEEGVSPPPGAGSRRCSDPGLSAGSDSGLSCASRGRTGAGSRAGKPVPAVDFEIARPLLEVMMELAACGGGEAEESGPGGTVSGEASSSERETDILDDEQDGGESAASSGIRSPSSEDLSETRIEYSTRSWVWQRQRAEARPPPRGLSSREAVRRGLEGASPGVTDNTREDDAASLTSDIDESIEQLNQLILDLDPTFVPVPTRCAPPSHRASLHANGLGHKGNKHLSGQVSDVANDAGPGWRETGPGTFGGPRLHAPPFSPAQHLLDVAADWAPTDGVPQTPSFPVSPPTPYVKLFSQCSSQFRTGGQWDPHSWTQGGRSFLDGANHAGGSVEGDLFRSDVSPASCQRIFGSARSVSSGSPLPRTDSSTPPPVWDSPNSSYPPQSSPPLSLRTPNAHSSPRGAPECPDGGPGPRGETDSADMSSLLLGNGGMDRSLLEAVEGLGSLDLGGGGGLAPLLPEKRRWCEGGELGSRSPSLSGFSSPRSGSSLSILLSSSGTPDPLRGLGGAPSPGADPGSKQDAVKFVQDTSRFWYKPDISRDQAIAVLKDKEPGSFVVRDSHSFRGAYGLAMKVATPPPSALHQSKKGGDLSSELVRHFLIECTQKGVRLKGCPNEPYFGSLTALVCQHSITPLALPCKLILPDKDPVEELSDSSAQTATNSAAELLKQGAACNVWYLGSVELESLTGHQAVQKATTVTLSADPPPASTVVHFKVSAQGVTLTDNQRKLFFRRHYAVNTVIFCSLDPQGRKWTRGSGSNAKIFGFVARKSQSDTENICHLFAEHDPEQPASAIVNFVSKVMIGSNKK